MSPRGHSADDVARAALRLLDDHGLPDLTMRRLATALEVQPSALYWHFPNKQSLLAELSDRIVGRIVDRAASGSAVDLLVEAHALRNALLAYRDGAEVVSSTLALGLGSSLAHDRLASAVSATGADAETARRVATTVLHYVLGFAWHEQQRLHYDSVGVRVGGVGTSGAGSGGAAGVGGPGAAGGVVGGDAADGIPAAAVVGGGAADGIPAAEGDPAGLASDDFAFGLALIADGLRARGRV